MKGQGRLFFNFYLELLYIISAAHSANMPNVNCIALPYLYNTHFNEWYKLQLIEEQTKSKHIKKGVRQ